MPTPSEYQKQIAQDLSRVYLPPTPIEVEWRAIANIRGLYSPRIDVAVGPFSVVRGGNCIAEYDELMDSSRDFIEQILEYHHANVTTYRANDEQLNQALHFSNFDELKNINENARCLLAIEIENKVSRKHLLGGAVNAAALGRLGIVVGWTENKVKALVKLQTYWDFLGSVGKNTFNTRNLVILSPQQLSKAILSSTNLD
jgi:hypothetical protein